MCRIFSTFTAAVGLYLMTLTPPAHAQGAGTSGGHVTRPRSAGCANKVIKEFFVQATDLETGETKLAGPFETWRHLIDDCDFSEVEANCLLGQRRMNKQLNRVDIAHCTHSY